MNSKSILLLGSIALDTIKTKYGSHNELLGGSATYAALSSSPFVKTDLVGIIGDDFPEEGRRILHEACNSTVNLVIENGKTFRWGGKYHDNGDDRDTLFTELGVFENFSPELSKDNMSPDYVFLANIHPELQLSVLNQCYNKPIIITDTMNLWIDTAKPALNKVLKHTDILLINESEAFDIAGGKDLESINKIHDLGPKIIIVKYGSKGSTVYHHNGESYSVGIIPIMNVIDPTGAGDSYGGGFVSALAQNLTIKEAMVRGTVMASFCIENFGVKSIFNADKELLNKRIEILSKE